MQLFLTMLKQETTSSFSKGHRDPPLHKILLNPWWKWATLESWLADKAKSGNVVLLWTKRIFILIFSYNDLIDCNKVDGFVFVSFGFLDICKGIGCRDFYLFFWNFEVVPFIPLFFLWINILISWIHTTVLPFFEFSLKLLPSYTSCLSCTKLEGIEERKTPVLWKTATL